jgi:Manganese containing catalase
MEQIQQNDVDSSRTADINLAGQGKSMFLHRKELIQPVNVGTPDARFGTYLLEQFGGERAN